MIPGLPRLYQLARLEDRLARQKDRLARLHQAGCYTMSEPGLSARTPLSSPEFSDVSGVSAPLLTPDTLTKLPPQLTPEDEAKVLTFFQGYALSQRNKDVMSWVFVRMSLPWVATAQA